MGALNKCALLQLCVKQIPVVVNAWDDAVKQGGDGLVVGDRQVMAPADGSQIGARTAALSNPPPAQVDPVEPILRS